MSTEKERLENSVARAIELCATTQYMIDTTAKQLVGLRTQCRTSNETIQKEIFETESKIITLFGKQLVSKAKLKLRLLPGKLQEYPKTEQFLSIVGLNDDAIKGISQRPACPPDGRAVSILGIIKRGVHLENLLYMSEADISRLLDRYHCPQVDFVKLNTALKNLKLWTDQQLQGGGAMDLELHWTCYKSASSSPYGGSSPKFGHAQRPSTSSLPPDTYLNAQSPQSPTSPPSPPQSTPASPFPFYPSPSEQRTRFSPPPTPPLVKPTSKGKFPTTPPPKKKITLFPDPFHPLTKSKSHESQLCVRVNQEVDISRYLKKKPGNLTLTPSYDGSSGQRKRSSDGSELMGGGSRGPSGQTSPLMSSPRKSPPVVITDEVHPNKMNTLVVPISPNTVLGSRGHMKHSIAHRWSHGFRSGLTDPFHKPLSLGHKYKVCKFQRKLVMGTCDLCNKHIFRGQVCKECKAKYHRDCATKAAPACGLPQGLLTWYLESLSTGDGSPNARRVSQTISLPASEEHNLSHASSVPTFQGADSGSATSSCPSSTPSSPALFLTTSATPSSPTHASPQIHVTQEQRFTFPEPYTSRLDSIGTASSLNLEESMGDNSDIVNTHTSNDSDKSDKTLVDTGCSSDRAAPLDRVDSQESNEDGLGQSWQRVNSISVALKEWDIPYEELDKAEVIGTGRFGTVFRGKWHGEVAIKMLNMDPNTDNMSQLQAFKLEVAMLRKTRHENLVLFMGACMKPPHLAIVTSLCRGSTLYTHIHARKEKFPMSKTVIIASQIAQGMGYLHAKGIIHRDLKTKNIFLEGGKVVITDFGLFSVTKLCHGNRKGDVLNIPQGWLCYLSPEIVRQLHAENRSDMELPFTEASDVYAFGTVWFELLCGEWPFKNQSPQATIYQSGKGMKQSLSNLQGSKDVKDILMSCWSYHNKDRPDFAHLLKILDKIPKKRLARSPSHPIQLSRSAESVF